MTAAEQRRLVRDGVARAGARLAQVEERLRALERIAFEFGEIERRVEALERRAWLPSSAELQRERHEAIITARREGWSVSAIAELTNVSRSRVAAIIAASDLPVPERVTAVNGNSYPARRAAARRRSTISETAVRR